MSDQSELRSLLNDYGVATVEAQGRSLKKTPDDLNNAVISAAWSILAYDERIKRDRDEKIKKLEDELGATRYAASSLARMVLDANELPEESVDWEVMVSQAISLE